MQASLTIAGSFVLGISVGYLKPDLLSVDHATTWALYALLFLVGLSVGSDGRGIQTLRAQGVRILVPPLCALIGSLIGGVAFGLFLEDLSVTESVAVGFGLGYYSLSSVIIEQFRGGDLMVIALLANILREITTILAAGSLGRVFGPLAPIVSGGATSMDTTLPAILAASGSEYAIPSVVNGTILTILVPVLGTLALTY